MPVRDLMLSRVLIWGKTFFFFFPKAEFWLQVHGVGQICAKEAVAGMGDASSAILLEKVEKRVP